MIDPTAPFVIVIGGIPITVNEHPDGCALPCGGAYAAFFLTSLEALDWHGVVTSATQIGLPRDDIVTSGRLQLFEVRRMITRYQVRAAMSRALNVPICYLEPTTTAMADAIATQQSGLWDQLERLTDEVEFDVSLVDA